MGFMTMCLHIPQRLLKARQSQQVIGPEGQPGLKWLEGNPEARNSKAFAS